MQTKWIQHPMLPDGQEVEVPAQSVSHYSHSGWEVMDSPPEWATVRPEDAAMAELTTIAREAAQMPEPPTDDKASDSESAPDNDESGSETGDQEDKPTDTKRSRRAPTKEGK